MFTSEQHFKCEQVVHDRKVHVIRAWSGPNHADEIPLCGTDEMAPLLTASHVTPVDVTSVNGQTMCPACIKERIILGI